MSEKVRELSYLGLRERFVIFVLYGVFLYLAKGLLTGAWVFSVFDNHKRRHLITKKSVKKPGSNKKRSPETTSLINKNSVTFPVQ